MMAFSSGLRVPTISARGERGGTEAEGAAPQPPERAAERAASAWCWPRGSSGSLGLGAGPSRAGSTRRFHTRVSRGRGPRAAGGLKEKGPSAGGSLGGAGGRRRYLLRPRKGMVEAGHIGHDGLLVGPGRVHDVCKRTRGVKAGGGARRRRHGAAQHAGLGPPRAGVPESGRLGAPAGAQQGVKPSRNAARPRAGGSSRPLPPKGGVWGSGGLLSVLLRAQSPRAAAPRAAYPRRPASWGCPGTSPPPRRRCSGWSRGRPGEGKTLGGRPGLLADGSAVGRGRGCGVGRGLGGGEGAELHLPQLVVLDELRPVPVDQGVEGEAVLPAARGESEGGVSTAPPRDPRPPPAPPEWQRGPSDPPEPPKSQRKGSLEEGGGRPQGHARAVSPPPGLCHDFGVSPNPSGGT